MAGKARTNGQSRHAFAAPVGVRVNVHAIRLFFFVFAFTLLLAANSAFGQDDPTESAPPPLLLISKQEKASLDARDGDLSDRTKLALKLMDVRIKAAETLAGNNDFDGVFRELGAFHGLVNNALGYLVKHDDDSGKVLDNFKRLDIGLRKLAPRLEIIRREMPLRYDNYVTRLIKYVRSARSKATDSLFDDTVVPVPSDHLK